jgi:beta-1,2-mannobiose phosphorylase / 1,2-beta-oligomannan phosphorylase
MFGGASRSWLRAISLLIALTAGLASAGAQLPATQLKSQPPRASFPPEFVDFVPYPGNPVFTGGGDGKWDAKIRERGWIVREGDAYHLWYTGYDGTREGIRQLGYATSPNGIDWNRWPENPLCAGHWVEDMMVVKQGPTYYMFAEGLHDEAQLLTSPDRVHWNREGKLDIHMSDGRPISPGPFGTPTAWLENGRWHLFYERLDAGVWLAKSDDLKIWTNVRDEPVLRPGPEAFDKRMIALNQIIKRDGVYYAFYHASSDDRPPRKWNTDVARSADLLQWEKYAGNPIVGPDHSSGILLTDGSQTRLYTMHVQIDLFVPRAAARPSRP